MKQSRMQAQSPARHYAITPELLELANIIGEDDVGMTSEPRRRWT